MSFSQVGFPAGCLSSSNPDIPLRFNVLQDDACQPISVSAEHAFLQRKLMSFICLDQLCMNDVNSPNKDILVAQLKSTSIV
jgi:hypothetical protein